MKVQRLLLIKKIAKIWKVEKFSVYLQSRTTTAMLKRDTKFFERRNGGLPVNRITYESISMESRRGCTRDDPLAEEKSSPWESHSLSLWWRRPVETIRLIVAGVGVDRVNLRGNPDTVGMHMLRKIASLTEYVRNSSVLFGMPMSNAVWQQC